MFALIKTNGATEIAIHIPGDDNCSTSLKQLALMLENNATFFKDDWNGLKVIKPEMSIVLGDQLPIQGRSENGEFALVPAGSDVLDESFEIATPEVRASYAKAKEEFKDQIKRLRNENEAKDITIRQLEIRIDAMERGE